MKIAFSLIALLLATAAPVFSQSSETPSAPAAQSENAVLAQDVTAAMMAWVKRPVLDAEGVQVVDEAGLPSWTLESIESTNIVPGDRILYETTLNNTTDEALSDFSFESAVPAEVTVDPATFISSEDANIYYATLENPADFQPIFSVVDGEKIYADPALIAFIRIDISNIDAKSKAKVSYEIILK